MWPGALSVVPFLADQTLERGLTDALLNALHQVSRALRERSDP